MGDTAEMVPFEELDGTKRMARWDMYAASLVTRALVAIGWDRKDCNFLRGVELDVYDHDVLSAMVYGELAAGDLAMGKKEPRLSFDEVASKITDRNANDCLIRSIEVRKINQPDAPKKRRAGQKKTAAKKKVAKR